jgi:hypothetical protein
MAAISVIEQRKNTTENRNARNMRVAGFLPGCAEGANLGGLLDGERLAGLIQFKRVEVCRFIPGFAAHAAVPLETDHTRFDHLILQSMAQDVAVAEDW